MTARVSLEESQTLGRFHQEVNHITPLDKRDLLDLLKLIDAPANLKLLFLILTGLHSTLTKAKAIAKLEADHFLEINFDKIIMTCDLLLRIKPRLEACDVLGGLFPDDEESKRQQLIGILQSNPLYSCLCFRPEEPRDVEIYIHVLAQVLLAAQIYRGQGNDLFDLDDGFLAVRKLANKKSGKVLRALPSNLTSPSAYIASFAGIMVDSNLVSVARLLERAYHGRRRKEGQRKAIEDDPLEQIKSALDDLDDYEHLDLITQGVLTDEESEEYARHGGSPPEFTGGRDDVPVPADFTKILTPPTLAELAFQGKQRSNQEALKNQLNLLGWNELNQFDVFVLCRYLNEAVGKQDARDILARDCLSLMFWLSASLGRVMAFYTGQGIPGEKSPEGLYLSGNRILMARLDSPGPQLATQDFQSFSGQAYQPNKHCNIPLPTIAHTKSLLSACRYSVADYFGSANGSSGPGKETVASVGKRIRDILSTLNSEFGTRLTPGRICHYWLHALARVKKIDLPSSMLFFGHSPEFSVARMHYTCASARHLEDSYRRICSETLRELGLPNGFTDEEPVNGHVYLGTPFCPSVDAVRSLVRSLRKSVNQAKPLHVELEYVINFHNIYALYTACMIAFATTYRAVRDPSLYEKDIHFASGLGAISDKDDEARYHSRLVWISDECQKQIVYYRQHLQRLYEIFSLESPALFRLFKDLHQDGRPLNLFRFQQKKTGQHEELSAESGAPAQKPQIVLEELKPSNIETLLSEPPHEYFLPANAHRHHLKNALLDSGCPGEVIEAQLGHWELGQEPWNRFSNLHPREFSRQLEKHLAKILKDDGWVAIAGCDQ